jgi:hypothetical protein
MDNFTEIICCLFGLALIYASKRRRFKRTNQYGIEQFSSYSSKIANRIFDQAIIAIGIALLAFGAISLTLEYADDWFWLSIILVAALAIENLIYSDRRKMNRVKAIK